MSYEKQTWETGDIVTSAKLNHMEDGIAESEGNNGLLAVSLTETGIDKSINELMTAFNNHIPVCLYSVEEYENRVFYLTILVSHVLIYGNIAVFASNDGTETIVQFSSVDADSNMLSYNPLDPDNPIS